jgi:SPP1 family phage portal protein
MYPLTPTYTEYINQLIEKGAPVEKDVVKEYIDKHYTAHMDEGEDYYFKRNNITKRQIYKYTNDGKKEVDPDATNNKLASGWHKLLVDQKVGYLVGDPITIGYKDETNTDPLFDLLGGDFDDILPELVKNASNKGKEWLHPYIDERGNFDYIIIPAQEFIPIYDDSKHKDLVAGIRFYPMDDGKTIKVEFWTDKTVTYYEIINGSIYLDANEEVNPAPHFYYGDTGYPWDKVPFVEFKNNEEGVSDLTFYKDFIDIYDWIMSDSANTLEDVQQFLYEIKGYEGTDIDQAVTNLKRFKGVAVSSDGGVSIKQGEVPMESIDSYLDRVVEDIYAQGQGVNTNTDKFGNSPSGIALKFLFSLLDMKASVLERKFTKALKQFMWFVTEYASIANIGQFDNSKATFTFNKSMLMNDKEQVDIAVNSPELSTRTKLENHPWVNDVEAEMKRKEEDPSGEVDLDEVDGDE